MSGPLLYLIYIDFVRFYLKNVRLISFADDTVLTVFISFKKGPSKKSKSRIGKAGYFHFIKDIVYKCSQDIFKWRSVELVNH